MNLREQDAGEDLAGFEAELKAMRPRAPGAGFADRVSAECELRALTPRAPSPGYADRVEAACVSETSSRIIPFVRVLAPLAAAAAFALALAPALLRETPAGAPGPLADASPEEVPALAEAALPELPEEALHLPVINLPDGSAYRPVLRPRVPSTGGYRAMPGGAVMPVSLPASAGVDYEPVVFE